MTHNFELAQLLISRKPTYARPTPVTTTPWIECVCKISRNAITMKMTDANFVAGLYFPRMINAAVVEMNIPRNEDIKLGFPKVPRIVPNGLFQPMKSPTCQAHKQ